jgi:predicted phosphodiesterase
LQIVLDKERSDSWQSVRGNHEDYVLSRSHDEAPPDDLEDPRLSIYRNSFWTYQQLNGELGALEAMPFQVSFTGPDGREVRVVHASMIHNRDGIYPETRDEELRKKIEPAPAVLCVGHTHRPLIRVIDQTLVANVGSVGMPFDRDTRACYGQLTWRNGEWGAEIIRLPYDHAQAEQDYFDSGFIPQAGPLTELMLLEFRRAQAHLHLWNRCYEQAVLTGEMLIGDSVAAYMAGVNGQ